MGSDPTCSWCSPELVSWTILHLSSSISPLFLIQVTVGVGLPVTTALKIASFPTEMAARMYRYIIILKYQKDLRVLHVIRGGISPYLLE